MKIETSGRHCKRNLDKSRKSIQIIMSFWAVCLLTVFLLPAAASAAREKIILDFDDNYYHAGRGEKATLYLRREVKQQYPGFNLKSMNLEKVVLVAKSRMGYGRAQLRVGENVTREKRIDGNPDQYHDNRRFTFDRAVFHNPSRNSRGRWQIHMRGNFVVRRVILVVNDCNCRCDDRGYGDWAYRGRTFGTRMYTWEWPFDARRRYNNR